MFENNKRQDSHKAVQNKARWPGNRTGVELEDNRPQSVAQKKQAQGTISGNPVQRKANNTGLPDQLKSGIENLSGHSMDDVNVHYNSDKPAQLNAHAYAQGTEIHIASGQEKHLPHEAWHVVQQKQGRVQPTMQMKGKVNINDDKGLEKEADVMGSKAMRTRSQLSPNNNERRPPALIQSQAEPGTAQRVTSFEKPGEDHSKTEAGIFGIGPAGWVFLERSHHGKTQYGWDNKPVAKEQIMYSPQNFFEDGWKTLSVDNRLALLSKWANDVLYNEFDNPKEVEIRQELTQNVKASVIIEREFGGGEGGFRQFVQWAATQPEANPQMRTKAAKVQAVTVGASQEEAYFQSKQGLVAILQENISRYYQGKPLIPTYLVIRKIGADAQSYFTPDMNDTRTKSKAYTTDKEIRMIYKLTKEAPDEKLRHIAQKTFFFQQQDARDENNRTFETIPAPWEHMDKDYTSRSTAATDNYGNDAVKKWNNRKRSGGKSAYGKRDPSQVPTWMQDLIAHRAEQEKGAVALSNSSGMNVKYEISRDGDNLSIKSMAVSQMGSRREKVTRIAVKELIKMNITFEKEGIDTRVIMNRPGSDYEMILSDAQAGQVKLLVNRIISENTNLKADEASEAGGQHNISLNLRTLKLERAFTSTIGINKISMSEILLSDITSVDFSDEGGKIAIIISTKKQEYNMTITRSKAESLRKLLLNSTIDERKVGTLPVAN